MHINIKQSKQFSDVNKAKIINMLLSNVPHSNII